MQTKIQRKERNLIEKFIITLPDFHWVNRAVFLNVLVRAATKKVPSIPSHKVHRSLDHDSVMQFS